MTTLPPRSVLVLEDDDSLLSLFQKVLEKAGYDVRSVDTEHAAKSLLTQKAFDAVIIDLSVSGSDHIFDFVSSIRVHDPRIIVLIISGYTPDDITYKAHSANVELMEKPFIPDELVRRLSSLLSARAA